MRTRDNATTYFQRDPGAVIGIGVASCLCRGVVSVVSVVRCHKKRFQRTATRDGRAVRSSSCCRAVLSCPGAVSSRGRAVVLFTLKIFFGGVAGKLPKKNFGAAVVGSCRRAGVSRRLSGAVTATAVASGRRLSGAVVVGCPVSRCRVWVAVSCLSSRCGAVRCPGGCRGRGRVVVASGSSGAPRLSGRGRVVVAVRCGVE